MKITEELIEEIECALAMRKKNGEEVWGDDDDIEVQIAGTFAGDKFIVIKNRTKSPVISSLPMDREHNPQHKHESSDNN
jgi:hypothetical protein